MSKQRFIDKYGPWALVTGASAGLGAEFARQLAACGLNLVLVARRADRLDELGQRLEREFGVDTLSVALDLSRPDFMPDLEQAIGDREIGLLVNNAGFGNTGAFLKGRLEDDLRMLDVNCRAPLILTHALGNAMTQRGRGGIIMLASVAGLIPNPYFAHYAATKAWDLFLGEGLHVELKDKGVDVLSLCPGPTRTEFFDVAEVDEEKWPAAARKTIMDADDVVAAALKGLGRRSVVIPGWPNRLLVGSTRITPRSVTSALAGRVMKMAGG
ncbi:MAG: SDR family oxidoreductase [Salinisphaeraceae bacterium]